MKETETMRLPTLALIALFSLATAVAPAQNLVTNPGFETGDFTGWTLSGGGAPEVDAGVGHTGTYAASLGAVPPDVNNLSQVLPTTPGQEYTLTFFAQTPEYDIQPGSPNSLAVYFGGNLIGGPFEVPDNADYEEYSYKVTATSSSSELLFAITNDFDYTQLDDISVIAAGSVAVPEPGLSALLLVAGSGVGALWLRRRRR